MSGAHAYAPWADIDRALTISGLIDHRHTSQRAAWARVLSGTDDQLAGLLLHFTHPAENFNLPPAATLALAKFMIARIEDVVERKVPMELARTFYAGYRAARP
jgi:hypothetical protein